MTAIEVLFVEDSEGDAELFLTMLHEATRGPFVAHRAATLHDALASLKTARADVVLLDLSLADAIGLEGVRALREESPLVPVVVLTGHDDEATALRALQEGAQDYLVKGRCDSELLARSLCYAIERARAEAILRQLARTEAQRADELAKADRRKDEFLATLAHELRNPLAAIAGATNLLEHMRHDDTKFARLQSVLHRQGRHLARLIDDLLDVSRMTQNKIVLQREVCNLKELVDDSLEARAQIIEARGQRVVADLAPDIHVNGDCTRLNQIVENLLDNASKYSPNGGEIRVSLFTRDHRGRTTAIVRLEDDGVGIDPAFLPRIFDLFVQADDTLERSRGGLGIGLTLVKCLAELHGGDVRAYSKGVGRGSAFELWLPTLPPSTVASPDDVSAPAARPARRVLVVEDNRDAADMLEEYLRHHGHHVAVAYDGKRGVALAQADTFDLAFIDIGLPELDGYQVAERIRAGPHGKAMALVALTGYGAPEQHQRVLSAGFDRHVLKPIEPAVLDDMLVSLWRVGS